MVYGCPKEKHEIFLHLYCYSLIIEHMLPPYKCANPPNKCLSFDLRTLLNAIQTGPSSINDYVPLSRDLAVSGDDLNQANIYKYGGWKG